VPPAVNVSCKAGGTAKYDMFRANMSVAAATAWCHNNSRCAGFSTNATAHSAATCADHTAVLDLHFVDPWAIARTGADPAWTSWALVSAPPANLPRFQIFAKPMAAGGRAVAILNRGPAPIDARVEWTMVAAGPGGKAWAKAHVRDLWAHKDLGVFAGSFTFEALASHATALLMVTEAV
jgi:hypothetical protein